jgi:hypothetical protein
MGAAILFSYRLVRFSPLDNLTLSIPAPPQHHSHVLNRPKSLFHRTTAAQVLKHSGGTRIAINLF